MDGNYLEIYPPPDSEKGRERDSARSHVDGDGGHRSSARAATSAASAAIADTGRADHIEIVIEYLAGHAAGLLFDLLGDGQTVSNREVTALDVLLGEHPHAPIRPENPEARGRPSTVLWAGKLEGSRSGG